MMMRRLMLSGLIVLNGWLSYAQDVHFTMFQAAPTLLNPAFAGVFEGNFRASLNYRSQWGLVSDPYRTYSFSADGGFFKKKDRKAYLGAGINFFQDVAGLSKFGTTQANISLSGILQLNALNTLSVGIQGAFAQQSFSSAHLQWDAQYTPTGYNPALPSNEILNQVKSQYFDFSAGALWVFGVPAQTMASRDNFLVKIGASYSHFFQPTLRNAYLNSTSNHSKIALHADMHFSTSHAKISYKPRVNLFLQGPSFEANLGILLRYLVQDGSKYTGNKKGFAVSVGAYSRLLDGISPSFELEWAGFTFGYAFDLNLSKFSLATKGVGGSEFYLKFQNPNPFFRHATRSKYH